MHSRLPVSWPLSLTYLVSFSKTLVGGHMISFFMLPLYRVVVLVAMLVVTSINSLYAPPVMLTNLKS